MTNFGAQALALLDHLGVEAALVGGTSLGANASLEMPVLDNALLGCALALTPLLADVALDSVSQDPSRRRRFSRDCSSDAWLPLARCGARVRELPNARLLEASSILELHLAPERLTEEIAGFTQGCFREKRPPGSRRRAPQRPAEAPLAAAEGSH